LWWWHGGGRAKPKWILSCGKHHDAFILHAESLLPTLAKLLQEEDPPAKQTNKQSIYI
jgi:hypothetical protein